MGEELKRRWFLDVYFSGEVLSDWPITFFIAFFLRMQLNNHSHTNLYAMGCLTASAKKKRQHHQENLNQLMLSSLLNPLLVSLIFSHRLIHKRLPSIKISILKVFPSSSNLLLQVLNVSTVECLSHNCWFSRPKQVVKTAAASRSLRRTAIYSVYYGADSSRLCKKAIAEVVTYSILRLTTGGNCARFVWETDYHRKTCHRAGTELEERGVAT